jgi:asparagine synthase (glutamine-hydrolysing)
MRPFHYHRSRTHGFMFASDEGALLGHPHVPRTLDEGRIADAIFGELEAYDLTSTFHTEILRLPPAHTLIATGGRLTLARYWKHEPQPPLRLKSDEAYRDSFREVLNEAVSCRMRGGATTTFMVSGGLDSSSSAALARERLQTEGKLLQTVSAVSGDRDSCIETRCARAFGYLPGVSPRFAELDNLGPILPELVALYSAPLSPFDRHNALLRAVYLTARKNGARAVIDGVGGDLVLSDGGYLAYLLQNGRLTTAWREARAAYQFWGRGANAYQRLYGAAKSAFVPSWSRPWIRQIKRLTNNGREDWQGSLIDPAFAAGVCLDERLMQGRQQSGMTAPPGSSARRAGSVFRIHNVAARERYEREAARIGIEPRDPFLDVRVIEHCLTLPVELMVRSGWTKFILRDAMVDRLPDVIRWRKGRKHLGWDFTKTVVRTSKEMVAELFEKDCAAVTPYVRMEPVQQLLCDFRRGAGLQKQQEDDFYKISQLARFISTRPMSGEGC